MASYYCTQTTRFHLKSININWIILFCSFTSFQDRLYALQANEETWTTDPHDSIKFKDFFDAFDIENYIVEVTDLKTLSHIESICNKYGKN